MCWEAPLGQVGGDGGRTPLAVGAMVEWETGSLAEREAGGERDGTSLRGTPECQAPLW